MGLDDLGVTLQPGNVGRIVLGVAVLSLVLGALVVAQGSPPTDASVN